MYCNRIIATIFAYSVGNVICFSIVFFLIKYIKDILILHKLTKNTYRLRKIYNVYILLSETTSVPFCWSTIKSHFVIIPMVFLEKNSDLKLAIRHELQHIRPGDTYWLHLLLL